MTTITNQNYIKETITLKKRLESAFLDMAERLKKIRDERLYDGMYTNFGEFLMDMKMSEGMASRLITVYEKFVLEYKMKPEKLSTIGWSSLYEVAKSISSREMAIEFVDKAAHLTRSDLADEIREHTSGCKSHDWGDRLILRKCNKCGKSVREYE